VRPAPEAHLQDEPAVVVGPGVEALPGRELPVVDGVGAAPPAHRPLRLRSRGLERELQQPGLVPGSATRVSARTFE
jgi:hypothetical protein